MIAANVINGGDGNDVLTGGHGSDTLTGGGGFDLFQFTLPTHFAATGRYDQTSCAARTGSARPPRRRPAGAGSLATSVSIVPARRRRPPIRP